MYIVYFFLYNISCFIIPLSIFLWNKSYFIWIKGHCCQIGDWSLQFVCGGKFSKSLPIIHTDLQILNHENQAWDLVACWNHTAEVLLLGQGSGEIIYLQYLSVAICSLWGFTPYIDLNHIILIFTFISIIYAADQDVDYGVQTMSMTASG